MFECADNGCTACTARLAPLNAAVVSTARPLMDCMAALVSANAATAISYCGGGGSSITLFFTPFYKSIIDVRVEQLACVQLYFRVFIETSLNLAIVHSCVCVVEKAHRTYSYAMCVCAAAARWQCTCVCDVYTFQQQQF